MKNLKFLMAATAFCFILFSGCEEDIESPAYNPNPDLAEVDSTVACEDPPLRNWLFQQFFDWGEEAALIAGSDELKMSYLAGFYSLYFENSSENQSFGPNGEYTDQINKTFTDLKRFWDIKADKIMMVAMNGTMLQDRNKIIAIYKVHYGYSDEKANNYADSIVTLLETYPQFLDGNHPAFTYNQLASPDTLLPVVGQVPAKIIIGDGFLQGFEALGYGDIAPQAILAHEYGHHIQYDLGVLVRGWQRGIELIPKTARRIELMADAYAAYYLSHPRGAAMQGESVQRFLEVFSNLGDCEFDGNSHHGTPTQRRAAAEWGVKLANDAHQEGNILPSQIFANLFDTDLENILKN